MDRDESDQCESDSEKNDDGPSRPKSMLAKKASRSGNEKSRRSTRQKNLVVRFGYNEYMEHHYVYMTHVSRSA